MIQMPPRRTTADALAVGAAKCLRFACQRHFPSKPIGNVAEVSSGGTPDTANPAMWDGDVVWVTPKDLGRPRTIEIEDSERHLSERGVPGKRLLPAGTILLSSRAPIGHLGIANRPLCTNQGFKNIICSPALHNRYLFHILRACIEDLEAEGHGNTFKEIPSRVVEAFEIPIPPLGHQVAVGRFLDAFYLRLSGRMDPLPRLPPPLEEQRRIVARIEELARSVEAATTLHDGQDGAIEALWLSTVAREFSIYGGGASAPGNAVTLLQHQARYVGEPANPKYNNAHPHAPVILQDGPWEIPVGWTWTDMGTVTTHLVDCVNDTPEFADTQTGFLGLKSTNIKPYSLDLTRRWYVSPEDFSRWNRRETPRDGDIVLTREAPMGHACQLTGGHTTCLTQRLMLIRTDERFVRSRFVLHFLNSSFFRQQVAECSRGLTTPHIRVQDAPKFKIPLPPLGVQDSIIDRLDSFQKGLHEVRGLASARGLALRALLPSILDKAFKGEL